ncbi:hypothetical protein SAY87_022142 [Trapa incisa]|uniref:Uncharacterized protein n=1 Tax=Trapa incisa TaxID=236973 RepID=A0AAN7JUR0_9MYRT|nr:hypothetical protein SAY87_022142 [Trapa incisa]
MWLLISKFKIDYKMLRRPDGTFDCHLAEYLDRKVPANANPVGGVFSFDMIISRGTSLQVRIYRPSFEQEPHQQSITDLEKLLTLTLSLLLFSFMVEVSPILLQTVPYMIHCVGWCR